MRLEDLMWEGSLRIVDTLGRKLEARRRICLVRNIDSRSTVMVCLP